ncbi:glycosyltransferase family 4 protein [Pseudomonas fluorescens]
MKVLVWTQYFWPENFHINHVVEELQAQGMDVTVLTGKPNYPEGKIFPGYRAMGIHTEHHEGVEIIRLPLRARGKNSGKGMALNYLSFIVSGYLFAPWVLRGRKFDVVFVYAPSPLLQALPAVYVSFIKRAALAVWVQDIWPETLLATGFVKSKMILKLVEYFVRYIYRFSDSILIQSEGFRSSVQRLTKKWSKIRLLPNSSKELARTAPPVSSKLHEIFRHFSVVFAGNLGSAQSCNTIVEAAHLLREHDGIKFFVVGGGSAEEAVAQKIQDLGVTNVELLGRISPEEVSDIYTVSSVLLVTLKGDAVLSATIPSKVQGYLAAGKPIIASCNGETARVILDAQAGLNSPAEDPERLADAVLELYNSAPSRLEAMGRCGREFFLKHYHLPARTAELIEHFQDLKRSSAKHRVGE